MDIPFIAYDAADPLLSWATVTTAIEAGHRLPKADIADSFLYRGDDTLLSRAAWIDGLGIAVKAATITPKNAKRGLPAVNGAMLVFEDLTGLPEAVIDFHLVTKWKTAGDSLLGAKLLARPDSQHLLIVGAGTVARNLVAAYSSHFKGLKIKVWNRTTSKAAAMVAELSDQYDISVATDLPQAVGWAHMICAATMAKEPVIHGDWLRPGQHLDLVGAFTPHMREVDDTALTRSRIFVDSLATTLDHIGELKIPLTAGVIQRSDICGDFHELVAGTAGRASDNDITLFKNGGGAHLDLMTGKAILKVWKDR